MPYEIDKESNEIDKEPIPAKHMSKLIRQVTDQYFDGRNEVAIDELIDISDNLLEILHYNINLANASIYTKEKRLKYPSVLPPYSLAALLSKTGLFGDPRCDAYTFLRKIHVDYNPNAVVNPVFHND